MWLVNLLAALFTLVRYAIPVVVGFAVFGIVSNVMGPIAARAYLGDMATFMVSGVLGVGAGGFLAKICWR